ncbi:MAG: hypothetical protein ACI9DC_002799 [Gammaproteobacteria bacterium]|jgi:hypothetical protein
MVSAYRDARRRGLLPTIPGFPPSMAERFKARERRAGRANSSERNAADGRISARPKGVHAAHHCCVAAACRSRALPAQQRLALPRCVGSEFIKTSVQRYLRQESSSSVLRAKLAFREPSITHS